MIKNKIKFINLLSIFTLSLFIFSCSSDTPTPITGSSSTPITLDGEWTSGSVSYHADESGGADCSSDAMTLNDFADIIIISNIQIEAEFGATSTCGSFSSEQLENQNMTEEECIAYYTSENITNLTTLMTESSITSYRDKISHSYDYGDMTLTLTEGTTNSYVISYDGECEKTDSYTEFSEAACNGIDEAEWSGTECVMTSFTSCEDIANGNWDAASTGLWFEGSGDNNYILEDFLGNEEDTTPLIFDGSSLYIVLDTELNHCICGDDATSQDYTGAECVLSANECVFLERYCVSLSFSK